MWDWMSFLSPVKVSYCLDFAVSSSSVMSPDQLASVAATLICTFRLREIVGNTVEENSSIFSLVRMH